MRWLSDSTVDHLRRVADWPDLEGTRYRILEPIGRGGMGAVFLTEDQELNRHVALKVLKDPDFDLHAAERMLKEARIIARLEHPGIVPVHDIGRLKDGRIYYVMKLVKGRRLDAYCEAFGNLTDRLRVFERICETTAFAHAQGVIHRDLKPQNIMVGEFGEVLVLDWGVAKLLQVNRSGPGSCGTGLQPVTNARFDDPSVEDKPPSPASNDLIEAMATAYGTVLGTPAYMPPEQARGELDLVTERSDVFSLGAILYFILTGQPPNHRLESAGPQKPTAILPPRRLNASIPRALNAICMKALATQPADRYRDAGSLGRDISQFLAGQSVSAYRENMLERTGRFARTYRTAILLVAAYLTMRIVLHFWTGR